MKMQFEPCLEKNNSAYSEALFEKYALFFQNHLLKKLHYRLHIALSYLIQKNLPPEIVFNQILDLGCGTGLMGWVLRPICHHLTGLDISQNMLEECHHFDVYDELLKGDLKAYHHKPQAAKFDMICCIDTFAYISETTPILDQYFEMLKPKGYFLGSIEPSETKGSKHQISEYGRYLHCFEEIKNWAKKNKAQIIDTSETVVRIENSKPLPSTVFLIQKI